MLLIRVITSSKSSQMSTYKISEVFHILLQKKAHLEILLMHNGKIFFPHLCRIFGFPSKMKVQILLFCFYICHKNAHFVLNLHGPVSNSYLLIQIFQFLAQKFFVLYEVKLLCYLKIEHETVMNKALCPKKCYGLFKIL